MPDGEDKPESTYLKYGGQEREGVFDAAWERFNILFDLDKVMATQDLDEFVSKIEPNWNDTRWSVASALGARALRVHGNAFALVIDRLESNTTLSEDDKRIVLGAHKLGKAVEKLMIDVSIEDLPSGEQIDNR